MGYGLIAAHKNSISLVEMGVLQLAKKQDHAVRLEMIFRKMETLMQVHRPDAVAIEAPFFGKNVQSMLKLGRAQGVAIVVAMMNGLHAVEYAPRKVKQVITGRGNASKEQVWHILKHTLHIDEDPRFMDATDAVAVALCHFYQSLSPLAAIQQPAAPKKSGKKIKNDWTAYIQGHPEKIK